jgi:hypothetical protein
MPPRVIKSYEKTQINVYLMNYVFPGFLPVLYFEYARKESAARMITAIYTNDGTGAESPDA